MRKAREFRYPGLPTVVDGSEAVAYVETRLSEACCAYPITPSTTMAALYQAAVADRYTNLWGTELAFLQLESEHSSASAAEGFALAGGRVTNFTAGQGLVLMKEVPVQLAHAPGIGRHFSRRDRRHQLGDTCRSVAAS